MLYIFDSTEKLITTLPKGSFFNAVHYEVLNGENTFEFSLPAGNENIIEGNLVAFRDLDSYWQIFEIKRIVDVHGDDLTRTAYCEHIFYELLDDIVIDKRPSAGATAALDGMLDGTRWQVGIVDDLGASSTSAYYEPVLSAVQKVANAWHGELNWRCVISGGVITRYVDLLAMRGVDTGKQFVYSKDILNIEREVDSSGVVTALYGRGKGVETESGAYGRRLTFADVEAPGKPLGQEWVGDDEALARWGRNGRHRFDVFVDEDETDPVKLLEKTRVELAERKEPRVTYKLDVVSLEELTGYEHEKVRLGDMVRVIDREFDPELVVSARVIEIERDLLDPTNTKVVLGSFAPTIVEATINTARRVDEMANRPFNTKWLDGKINVLQNAIENTQSYVFQTGEDGILILDAPTYDHATKAMKLGGGIFAIANQKDGQGGWNWRTFGDGSGFTADLITAGMIDAGLVQIGPQTTFAPGYDPSQIEGASAVGMGVDADCLGLWHFDGSLNSHKGVAAIGDANFDTGCFGQAVKIEEGTTNLIPESDHDFEGNSWVAYGGTTVTVTQNQPDPYGGNKATRIRSNGGPSILKYYGSWENPFIAGDYSAQSVWVKVLSGSLVVRSHETKLEKTITVGGWQKVELIGIIDPAAACQFQFRTENAGDSLDILAFQPQKEKKDHVTPYTPTSRLGVLKAPTTGLSVSQGMINFRAKNLAESGNGSVLIDLPKSDNTQGLRTGIANDGKLYISDSDKISKSYTETTQADFNSGVLTDVVSTSTGNLELIKTNYTNLFGLAGKGDTLTGWTTDGKLSTDGEWIYNNVDSTGGNGLEKAITGSKYYFVALTAKTTATTGACRLNLIRYDSSNNSLSGDYSTFKYTNMSSTAKRLGTKFQAEYNATKLTMWYIVNNSHVLYTKEYALIEITADEYNNLTVEQLMEKYPFTTGANITYYPFLGTREKIVDLSGANPAEGTSMSWSKTTPTNTTVTVETALSLDGGSTYGTWQEATNGGSIPGITTETDLPNARLKIRETLSTTDTSKTPQLHSLSFSILESAGTAVYGPNKSTLTGWDSISLAWKPERLSLVVNDEEACYIENPGLPASLDSHVFIGTDRNGANAINTLVDELRIDKVYREVNIRTGWHKTGVPFYTSEDMKQWPGYLKAETDGLKVYDSSDDLRVLVGSWLKDAVRKYGIKIIDGEIYSSLIRSGAEDATEYIQLVPPNSLQVWHNSKVQMNIHADTGARIDFFRDSPDASALNAVARITGGFGGADLGIMALGNTDKIGIAGNLDVSGTISAGGSKPAQQVTENYGLRYLYAIESPEILYFDRYVGRLENGEAVIKLDPIFLECIEPDTELTPWSFRTEGYGENDIYVAEWGKDWVRVKERNGGTSNNKFVLWIEAVRRNYAGIRLMEVTN